MVDLRRIVKMAQCLLIHQARSLHPIRSMAHSNLVKSYKPEIPLHQTMNQEAMRQLSNVFPSKSGIGIIFLQKQVIVESVKRSMPIQSLETAHLAARCHLP